MDWPVKVDALLPYGVATKSGSDRAEFPESVYQLSCKPWKIKRRESAARFRKIT